MGTNLNLDLRLGSGGGRAIPYFYPPQFGNAIKTKRTTASIYVRSYWDATYDIVYELAVRDYRPMRINYGWLVAKNAAIDSSSTLSAIGWGDDVAPIMIGGGAGYVGAAHGWDFLHRITKTAHGISDYANIGTKWTDGNGRDYYLVSIENANVLYFAQIPTYSNNTLYLTYNTSSGTLTQEVSGTELTGYTEAKQQLRSVAITPNASDRNYSLNGYSWTLKADGVDTAINTEYTAKYAVLTDSYYICNPVTEMAAIIAKKGSYSANPTWDETSPAGKMTNTHFFEDYGVVRVYQSIELYQNFLSGYLAFWKAGVLILTVAVVGEGAKVYGYVPNTKTTKAINATMSEWVSTAAAIAEADKIEAGLPINRLCQISQKSDTTRVVQFAAGYVPQKTQASGTKLLFNIAGKAYPRLYDTADVLLPLFSEGYSFRSAMKAAQFGTATAVYWYNAGKEAYIIIEYHATADETITLPAIFEDAVFQLIEKTGGFDIAESGVLTDSEIAVDVTVADGICEYAIIKVTK